MSFLNSSSVRFVGGLLLLILAGVLPAEVHPRPAGGQAGADTAGVDSLAMNPPAQPVRTRPGAPETTVLFQPLRHSLST